MRCTLAYATPAQQVLLELDLPESACVADALSVAAVKLGHAVPTGMAVGIFGEVVSLQQQIQAGDRLEIYRPLTVDPKESRRARAQRLRCQR